MNRRLHEMVILPMAEKRRQHRDHDGAGDRGRKKRGDCAGHSPQEPTDTRTKGKKICSGRQASEGKAENEAVIREPSALFEKLVMQDSGCRAATPQGEIGVARKHPADTA